MRPEVGRVTLGFVVLLASTLAVSPGILALAGGHSPDPGSGGPWPRSLDLRGGRSTTAAFPFHPATSVNVGGAPYGLAYDPALGEVFVANEACGGAWVGNISVINDTTARVVASVNVSGPNCDELTPWNLVYDSGKGEVFAASIDSDNVTVINASDNRVVAQVPVGNTPANAGGVGGPIGLAYDSGTGQVFVTDCYGTDDNVSVISDTTDKVVATVSVGEIPLGAVYDPGTHQVFVFNNQPKDNPASTTSVISDVTDKVVATISTPGGTYEASYDSGTAQVFYAGYQSVYPPTGVGIISDTTDRLVKTVGVGVWPSGIAYDPANGEVYVTNEGSNNVSAISDATDKVVGTFSVASEPFAIAYDAGKSELFVANSNSSNVTIIPVPRPPGATVTFTETGIPPKLLSSHGWAVDLNGTTTRRAAAQIVLTVRNGTYPLWITGPAGYAVTQPGVLDVAGATTVSVVFEKGKTVTLGVHESGLPKGQPWCVAVRDVTQCTVKSSLTYTNLEPGIYSYAVQSPLSGQSIGAKVGKTVVPTSGNLTLTTSETVSLTFVYPYAVTFTESGHPNGTWSVTLKGKTLSNATGEPIVFSLPNGTYGYKVGATTGYTVSGSPAKVKISGASALVQVTFQARGEHGPAGLGGGARVGVLLVGGPVLSLASVGVGRRRRPTES